MRAKIKLMSVSKLPPDRRIYSLAEFRGGFLIKCSVLSARELGMRILSIARRTCRRRHISRKALFVFSSVVLIYHAFSLASLAYYCVVCGLLCDLVWHFMLCLAVCMLFCALQFAVCMLCCGLVSECYAVVW